METPIQKSTIKFYGFIILCLFNILSLTACTPMVFSGAAVTAAIIMADRRTTGTQLEDSSIELKIENRILKELNNDITRITVTSYNRHVLLTGDASTRISKQQASQLAKLVDNVITVNNQIKIRSTATLCIRSRDAWIASKVRTALLNAKYVPSGTILVTVDHGIVFLMGLVTRTEGRCAALVTANIDGVNHVMKYFEYINSSEDLNKSIADKI